MILTFRANAAGRARIAAILGVALTICAAGVTFYHYRSKELRRQLAQWRADGIAAFLAGDHPRAVENLQPYLRRNEADAEAMWYYVQSRRQAELPRLQHVKEAVQALKRYLELCPDHLEGWHLLLEQYLRLDRRNELADTADAILAKWPADVQALRMKTEALVRLRRYREALDAAARWAEAAPLDVAAHMQRLSLQRQLDHPSDQIIADARAQQEKHPQDPRFELLRGFACVLTNDRDQAEQWLRKAAQHPPPDDAFCRMLVSQLDGLGLRDESLAVLRKHCKGEAGVELRCVLVQRLWEMGRWEEVVVWLEGVDPADAATDVNALAMGAMSLSRLGRLAEAERYRDALKRRATAVARAWCGILGAMENPGSANSRRLISECRAALSQEPYNQYMMHFLAEAYARLGEADLAIDIWKRAAASSPGWSLPVVRAAEEMLRNGLVRPAVEAAAAAMRRDPYNAAAAVALACALAADEEQGGNVETDELLTLVSEVQRQLPGEDYTFAIQIRLLAQKGQKEQAVALIRSALGRTPAPSQRALLAMAAASELAGLGLEEECLRVAEREHGASPEIAYFKASRALKVGDSAGAIKVFDAAHQMSAGKDEILWQLARVRLLDIADDAGARAAWIALAERYPEDLRVQRAALRARAPRTDRDFIRRTVERVRSLTGDDALEWKVAHARWLADSDADADRTQAALVLQDIIRVSPGHAEAHLLLAMLLDRMGRIDDAINELRIVAGLDPYSVPVSLRLAQLLQTRGDSAGARSQLDRVAARLRRPEDQRQAALLLARQGDWGRAIRLMEQPEAANGKVQPDLLLAILYRQQGRLDEAENVCRKLLEEPNLAVIQFAAELFSARGRYDEAEKALALLDQLRLPPGIKEMVLGRHYSVIGRPDEALRQFRRATQLDPKNPVAWRILVAQQFASRQLDDALASLNEGCRTVPDDAALSAIAQHVELLKAAAPLEVLHPAALSFLHEPVNNKAALESLKTGVEIAQSEDVGQASSRLRKLVESFPNFLPNHLLLMQNLYAVGRTDEAIAAADRAANLFPTSIEPVRMAVAMLGNAGRWKDMLAWAGKWRDRAQGATGAADTAAARAHIGMGRYQDAVNLLKPYLRCATAEPSAHAELLMVYAQALCGAGDISTAEQLLWPLVEKDPSWRARWINLAGELLDPQTAAGWLTRAATVVPDRSPDERAILALAWHRLGRRTADQEHIRQASELFAALVHRDDATVPVLLAAAIQREECNDFPAAESLYRRVLGLQPRSVVALNNLALLIARRGGDLNEAQELAAMAIGLSPREANVYDTMATIQAQAGNHAGAIDNMRKAARLEPANAKWQIRLAQCLMDGGSAVEAAKVIESINAAKFDLRGLSSSLKQQLEALRARVASLKR